jgi:RNA polymerase sigma-70 factor (ECF subfamily)
MMTVDRTEAEPADESELRAAFERGALHEVATQAMRTYGPPVLRFLMARLRTRTQAEDAYLQFAEDLWTGLPSFRWQCSLRVWLFVLARSAATRIGTRAHVRREQALPDTSQQFWGAVQDVRTTTALHLQTGVKVRLRELRARLDDDEQTLLILRVNRGLAWKELAMVMGELREDADEDAQARASARMRTRFQAAKKKLRQLAEREGLLEG